MSDQDWKLPWDAHCRCERLHMRITTPPMLSFACHCTGCQRMSASAFSLTLLMASDGFEVVAGETVIGGIHGPDRHFHCAHCKTWAFTRPNAMDQYINVRATMLDDHAWIVPFAEACTSEGFAWAKTGARHSFPKMPGMEVWPAILEEFARDSPRPR